MTTYITELIEAIRRLHGCEATHVETVPVTEVFLGQTIWEGDVEVFDVRGHPVAKRAYAWSHEYGVNNKKRFVAVLELPPVVSAEIAVKMAIGAEIKAVQEKAKSSSEGMQ